MTDSPPTSLCSYRNPLGESCNNPAGNSGLCCWHDDKIEKKGEEWKQRLQEYAHTGASMSGFKLRQADLSSIDLINHHHKNGLDLSYTDLYRANLQNSHLFKLNLRGASLMKADLRHANLHYANLQEANLLGVNFDDARIEHVDWGEELFQITQAKKALQNGEYNFASELFEESEEIFRNIRKTAEKQGLFELAGKFFYSEMVARRMQLPLWSGRRFLSKVVDLICGYGEKPLNVIVSSLVLIVFCALLYWLMGVYEGDQLISLFSANSFEQSVIGFFQCLYYSVVTFTTLGYGDITPVGLSRAVAAVEAFTGSFSIALFVVVFVKKMTR